MQYFKLVILTILVWSYYLKIIINYYYFNTTYIFYKLFLVWNFYIVSE